MIIISDQLTARSAYILQFILEEILGFNLRYNEMAAEGEAVIAYQQEKPTAACFYIKPCGLLNEQGVSEQILEMGSWEEYPVFFMTGGDIPFDIFSAAFYLVSRYEEYLPHQKDSYGRFAHQQSLAYKEGFLQLPLVDLWAVKLREEIRKRFPLEPCNYRKFHFVPSYDIDHAWRFKHKGWMRTIAHTGSDVLGGNWDLLRQRKRVLMNKEKDPYDVYEWLDALHLRYGLKPYYFFPLAVQVKGYDRNISPFNHSLRQLLTYHASGYRTGIHPSWQSGDSNKVFQEELALFAAIAGNQPLYSRFHYIRFSLPLDYRKLILAGIHEEHSMGYGTINGFRASTSHPFFWFDLVTEEVTRLRVHPYCWMDANSYYEQHFTPAQAYAELQRFHDVIKKVQGNMEIICHNNFLSEEQGFAGWKEVYEIFLDQVVYWEI